VAPETRTEPTPEGRDASSGRFTAGNHFGKGNPHARRMASLRQAFLSVATEERMRALGEKVYAEAIAGDWQAVKMFLMFVIGRPAAAVNPDTLDSEEWKQCQEWPHNSDVWAMFSKVVFSDAIRMRDTLGPTITPLSDA
jgi:hypothetical protein